MNIIGLVTFTFHLNLRGIMIYIVKDKKTGKELYWVDVPLSIQQITITEETLNFIKLIDKYKHNTRPSEDNDA